MNGVGMIYSRTIESIETKLDQPLFGRVVIIISARWGEWLLETTLDRYVRCKLVQLWVFLCAKMQGGASTYRLWAMHPTLRDLQWIGGG
jgi:hypothetical protein